MKHKMFRRDVVGRSSQTDYLRRWVFETPWFSIRLHRFGASDPHCMHDHPWPWFISLVLWRGYVEEQTPTTGPVLKTSRRRWPGSLAIRFANDRHRVVLVDDKPAWTLVLTGPIVRTWGFHTPDGFVPSRRFDERKHICD